MDPSRLLRWADRLIPYGGAADDPDPPEGGRLASVAVVLRPIAEPSAPLPAEILLIRRAELPGDPWSGQIALPGGRRDPRDASLLDTALREAQEETGLRLPEVGSLLGRLHPINPRSRRLPIVSVTPFVFAVPAETAATAASREVAEAFWSPLDRLRDETARTVHRLDAEGTTITFPALDLEGRIVWGMTHGILTDLLGRIG